MITRNGAQMVGKNNINVKQPKCVVVLKVRVVKV
jgi:hypothetical protein